MSKTIGAITTTLVALTLLWALGSALLMGLTMCHVISYPIYADESILYTYVIPTILGIPMICLISYLRSSADEFLDDIA